MSLRIRNVLANWGTYVFATALAFFLSPYVVKHLGDAGYGVWTLVGSLTGYLGLLDFGVRQAVTRYVARAFARGDSGEASRVMSSAAAMFAASGVVAVLGGVAISAVALEHFGIPSGQLAAARTVVAVSGLTVALSLMSGVFAGSLAAANRFDLLNLVEFGAGALRAAAVVAVLQVGWGITGLALVQLVMAAATLVLNMGMTRRLMPDVRLRLSLVDRGWIRLLVSFSAIAFLLQCSNYLVLYADALVIGLFLPVSHVTFFAIAGNLAMYARQLTGGISQTLAPLAAHADAAGRAGELADVALTGGRYTTAIVLPVAVTFALRGSTFIALWMGESYAVVAGDTLRVLAVAVVCQSGVSACWSVMFGVGKHRALVPLYLAEAIMNIVLSAYLVRHMGVVGVAWGTAIPSVVAAVGVWPVLARRALGIGLWRYVTNIWLRPMLAVLPFAVVSAGMEHFYPATTLPQFVMQVTLTLPIGLAGIWLVCTPRAHRQRIVHSWRTRAPFVPATP